MPYTLYGVYFLVSALPYPACFRSHVKPPIGQALGVEEKLIAEITGLGGAKEIGIRETSDTGLKVKSPLLEQRAFKM